MAVVREPTIDNPGGIKVDPKKKQYLHFLLKVSGPIAIFTFASNISPKVVAASDFDGHPRNTYEWNHLKDDPAAAKQLELLDLRMVFISCREYEYFVEVRGEHDSVVQKAMQIKYTGGTSDVRSESFNVILPE